MKKLAIKVLITAILMFTIVNGLDAQFVNGFYNGEMPVQMPFGSLTDPFRGLSKPNTTEWDGIVPSNEYAYFPILIVFVQFADDPEGSPFSSWPKGYAPTYINTMIATEKNLNNNIPWWEKYDPETEAMSSQWMEISRGRLHAISPGVNGQGAFSVVLGNSNEYNTEQEMNQAIWKKLWEQGLRDWRPYDKWYRDPTTGIFYNTGDGEVDFIYKIHRSRGMGPMPNHAGFSWLAWDGGSCLVDTTNNITAEYTRSGFTVSFRGLKSQYIATCGHEHGHHTLMGGHVQNSRTSYGIGFDYFFSPYDMILSEYMTPRTATFGATNTLGDFSSRNNNLEGEVLKIPIDNTTDESFLLANRRKISKWDRVMMGDSAQIEPYEDNSELGKGLYIYHVKNGVHSPNATNDEAQDMECADGYWKWNLVSTGGIAKLPFDCFTSGPAWKVFQKDSVLYSNDPSVLGQASGSINLGNPLPYGDDVSFFYRYQDTARMNSWTTGKNTNQNCGLNVERTFTNDIDIISNGNNAGDRYDAWKPGYNEVFSPYSSPSTKKWNNQESGIFIWYNNTNGNTANINIYRATEYGGNQSLASILEATPPSRPMGIKHEYYYPSNSWCVPKITWNHNMEPDMERGDDAKYKRYEVWRVTATDMSTVPDENNYALLDTVDIYVNEKPYYIDYSVLEHECAELDQQPPYGTEYPVRYRVKAVDNTNKVSVRSDFVSTTGITPEGGDPIGGGADSPTFNSNTPKEFNLSQNYPNPFNPVTKINFALPKQGFVSLKIYDITGREIQTLVSDVKQAGYYSVDFNGSSLSSGVYFYMIKSGDFVMTKRMVLIK